MKSTLLWIISLFGFLSHLSSQQKPLSQPVIQALNNYVHYTNETSHALHMLKSDFERINQNFNQYLQTGQALEPYVVDEVWTNEDYFAVLPKDWFEEIGRLNPYLPAEHRAKPLQLADQLQALSKEIEAQRVALSNYIYKNNYKNDKNLKKGYALLHRIEVLYIDIYSTQVKLRWLLQQIHQTYIYEPFDERYPPLLKNWQGCVGQAHTLSKALRLGERSNRLELEVEMFGQALLGLSRQRESLLKPLPRFDTSAFCPHRRYGLFEQKARILEEIFSNYIQGQTALAPSNPHDTAYQAYEQVLGAFNRYGEGLVTIYNQTVERSGEFWLLEFELVPQFKVHYPDIPGLDLAQTDSSKPSIKPQSSDSFPQSPRIKSLEGFAFNHLIFLLDVSGSMQNPDRLPLLKTALKQMLELMRPEDNISIVTYSGKAKTVLPPTSAHNKAQIIQAIEGLQTQVHSDADYGLQLAYQLARAHFIRGGNNRIILASDGGFKLKAKSKSLIKKNYKRRNIRLSTFYFSPKEFTFNRNFLEFLAELGGGFYAYIRPENIEDNLLREMQARPK